MFAADAGLTDALPVTDWSETDYEDSGQLGAEAVPPMPTIGNDAEPGRSDEHPSSPVPAASQENRESRLAVPKTDGWANGETADDPDDWPGDWRIADETDQ